MNIRGMFVGLGLVILLGACTRIEPKQSSVDPQATNWQQLGYILDIDASHPAQWSSLAVDSSGNPVVGWTEYESGQLTNPNIYVKRWTGSSWQSIGGALDVTVSRIAYIPSLSETAKTF